MAALTDAQVTAFFDQKWDMRVLQARYGKAVIMPRVLNKSDLVSDSGQIIHIPLKPRLAGQTVGADGTFTTEQASFTDVQITVDTWKAVSQLITDKQSKQSFVTLETELPSQFGERLAEFYDIALANLILQLSGGSDANIAGQGFGLPGVGVKFVEDTANGAVLSLRKRNIPLEDMSWLLSPECFYLGWLTKERLTNANSTGLDKSNMITNARQNILGIPAFESTLLNGASTIDDNGAQINPASGVNLPGTTACALIKREALAIAMQINNRYEKVRTTPAGQLGTLFVAQNLFGTKVVRANHGAIMYVTNS